MTALLVLPLLLPFALPALARRALGRLAPATALWAVTGCAVALACCSLAAFGALALVGLLKLPVLASLGELTHPLRTASGLVVLPTAVTGAAMLALSCGTLLRSVVRQARALRAARAEAGGAAVAGDLCVVDAPGADAYALPGRPHRVVVTTGMLRALDGPEREALFAHERAHNAGGHHWFLAAAELAAHCHPALRPVRATVRLAAERAADEAAARRTGDRRVLARAIARAALAAPSSPGARPGFAAAATTGPVPARVHALLEAPGPPARAGRRAATALLVVCAAVSGFAAVSGTADFHHRVEVAQGEARP
ncbi:M48 family metalloprotease [Streptomyces sp. J2-1]|uniref:M48 family metalloprotease n=1 Tax=Streptomyces corallincola TaxID=2851888 RepID=UPI001C37F600|nr:M48 family metalloprotease [Streptomyces corallincola]MBV2353001.1 M48 family metalloprotease [Streptomyces corallincola]